MKKTIIYVCLAAFLFATMEVGLKLAGSSVDTLQMTYVRFLIAGLILIPFAFKESLAKGRRMRLHHFKALLLLGGVYIPISMTCFQVGVVNCNASTASVMISFTPIFVIIVNAITRFEGINVNRAIVVALGLIGMFFIIRPWDMQSGNSLLGVMLLVLAPLVFSLYTVYGKKVGEEIGIMTMTSISFIISAIVVLLLTILTQRPILAGLFENWIIVLYVSVCATGLGYLFYFLIINDADATTGALVFYIKPAIAPVMALIMLDESIYWDTIVGILALFAASYINLYKPSIKWKKCHGQKNRKI